MKHIHLSSDDRKFTIVDNCFRWEMPNLIFAPDEKLALSEIAINPIRKTDWKLIKLKTTLINNDYMNPDGVIFTQIMMKYGVNYSAANLVFWNIEYQRPRVLMFTLEGMNVTDIDFISLTLTVKQHASRSLVS
jgi:hypothetical protein